MTPKRSFLRMADFDGLRQASSLCLDVEFLKFGESFGKNFCMPIPSEALSGERVETRRESRKAR